MSEIRHSFVKANGIRIHVAEQGEGPLVLLVHGFPELWYSYRHQLPALAEAGYRAVAIDQRGYGRSSKLWDPLEYRISNLVGDVIGVVRALGESQAVIVGHDWGAPVAWTAAWQHPDIFRAVVGLSVPFSGRMLVTLPGSEFGELPPSVAHRRIAGEGNDFYQEYFSALGPIIHEFEEDARGWIAGLVLSAGGDSPGARVLEKLDPEAIDPVELLRGSILCVPHGARMRDRFLPVEQYPDWFTEKDLDFFAAEFERTGLAGGLSFYHAMEAGWEELAPMEGKPVTVPALFMAGQVDPVTLWSAAARARQKEHVPNLVDSVILPGCGHWIQQERPKETNEHLIRFLRGLPRG